MDQPTPKPTDKVIAGAIGGAVTTIVVFVTSLVSAVEIPPEVAAAATVLFGFVFSYFTRERTASEV